MNNFKKKLENIWYYYKAPIVIGVIAILLVTYTVINKMNTPKYDYSIAIISKTNYPSEENVNKLKKIFEEKLNGSIDVVIYDVALGEVGEDDTTISKLDLDLINNISKYLFIEDLEAFKKTTSNIEFEDVVLVKDIDWLKGLGLDNFYFATRK